MKKFVNYLKVAGSFFGSIGGIVLSLCEKNIFLALCIVVLSVVAFPEVKKAIDDAD